MSSNNSNVANSNGRPVPPAAKKKAATRQGEAKKVSRKAVRLESPRWVVPVMLACFIIGLIWIVAYYVAPQAPGLEILGWWNVVVGFAFLAAGFVTATRWK